MPGRRRGRLHQQQLGGDRAVRLPAGTTSITAVTKVGHSADVLDLDWYQFV
ncbi:hypothetical protein ACQP1P_13450 [Dactylosporangium sp. CA-052675]|uniref:hypothetical protein n=1 Tax=Dactylosporangium sp. CA-052675 TaxID=3239927 RepID=UPI003D8E390B